MTDTEFQVGELIENRYRVLDVIGKGGMGTLYRVADEAQQDKVIALKMVRLERAGEKRERIEHFQREFQLLTQLRHPNLVSVYDYGITVGGGIYFTMEWAEGQDLELHGRRLMLDDSVSIIIQVCRALGYLHSRGVIHGDLKPANVLMSDGADERVKIIDFGIALEVRSAEARARYYSPGYSAPEIKEPRPINHRADLYSLGALWYALLVGEPPVFMFGAEHLIKLTLNEALKNQAYASEIGAIIAQLLATPPDERYASANEVIEAVNRVTGSTYTLETRETASSYALRTQFVNRETEIEILQMLWEQAQSTEGKLILISGESGIGKTRLVRELEVQAELGGARVVWGQCVERGESAYHPWREVLRVLVRYVEAGDEAVMRRVGPVLATLLPELWERTYMVGAAPPAELDPQAAGQRLNNAIVQVLQAAAGQRPTMVVIEDVHWADEATLALLGLLARTSGQTGLLVCVTYRVNEISPDHLLASLMGERVLRIPLQLLSTEHIAELVRSMLGLEELPVLLSERVQRTTEGNAFFAQELIRSLAVEGKVLRRTVSGWQVDGRALQEARLPESIQQVVERRMEQLSEETRDVIGWAAVMGMVFWEGAVADIGQVTREWVRTALHEVLGQGLIVARDESTFEGETEYLFHSSVLREASYERVAAEERQAHHKRVAAWVMERVDEDTSQHLGLIAHHLERAGQVEQAVGYLRRAGEQAAAQFANEQAILYLSRALVLVPEQDITTRYELLLTRETVYHLQGARDAQIQDLNVMETLVQIWQRPGEQAEVASRRAKVAIATGDYAGAIEAIQVAVAQAQAAGDVERESAAQLLWGETLRQQNKHAVASEHLTSALALAKQTGQRDLEAECLLTLGLVTLSLADRIRARDYYEQSLEIAREIGHRRVEGRVLRMLGGLAFSQGDHAGAQYHHEQSLEIAREMGHRQAEGWALHDMGFVARLLGDYGQAWDYFDQVRVLFREIGDRRVEGITLLNLGVIARSLGDYAKAREYFEQSIIIAREIGDQVRESLALNDLGVVAIIQGDHVRARNYCEQALTLAREVGHRVGEGHALIALGDALVGLVRVGDAIADSQQPTALKYAQKYLDDAVDAFHHAVDIRRGLHDSVVVLEPLAGLARAFLVQGDTDRALLQIGEIMDYLDSSTLSGISDPFRIYLTCYHVLCAYQDSRARDILTSAHNLLQEQAAKISDEEMRRSFLENVAVHREIVNEWRKLTAAVGPNSDSGETNGRDEI
ncbi:MAG: tetratricopeptide repeat protein [Chloroflexi bacterium]|nr:tetratricopeptide repeat protein [Chloroflexota bacterium]